MKRTRPPLTWKSIQAYSPSITWHHPPFHPSKLHHAAFSGCHPGSSPVLATIRSSFGWPNPQVINNSVNNDLKITIRRNAFLPPWYSPWELPAQLLVSRHDMQFNNSDLTLYTNTSSSPGWTSPQREWSERILPAAAKHQSVELTSQSDWKIPSS